MQETVGLELVRGASVPALAADLARQLAASPADPFEAPLVLTPGAGVQRWLSQYLARALDPGGEGICAGLALHPLARLGVLLSGVEPDDDPWSPERLVWPVLDLADAGTPGLEALTHHLAASEQRYANATRVARLLGRYAAFRPAMVQQWARATSVADLGLGFDAWQAVLWRALHDVVPGPDPATRGDALRAGLVGGHVDVPWPSVAVFLPRRVAEPDATLLQALAARVPVGVWALDRSDHPLAPALGRRTAETTRVLAGVATRVRPLEAPAPAEPRILVHSSHGPERQVEVLRDVLAGLFADDPGLEPREVAVLSPALTELAPHLGAAFGPLPDATADVHPARRFRVQVAGLAAGEANQLYRLVRDVVRLGSSRATAGHLLELAGHPFVARRFGLDAEDAERLADLVPASAIRWGLNVAHRRRFGLPIAQNTWQVGVQRLLLGVSLGGGGGVAAGFVTPVDEVESSDIPLVGAMAELVSRTTRLVAACASPATACEWVARFRAIADSLTEVPFDDGWQLAQWWAVLEVLERRGQGARTLLGSADALALLEDEFAGRTTRPAYGTGGAVVSGLGPLDAVPHRVVCLVGVDDDVFPRRGIADGDDLLARDRRPGEPDPGADDRQSLLDALHAAGSHLVVVHQGRSSLTNEARPPAPGLVDLLEYAGPDAVTEEPLQPFAPTVFGADGVARSFDTAGLAAARALCSPRTTRPNPYEVGRLPVPAPEAVDLDHLGQFVRHPAAFFLRQRTGLSLGEADAVAETLPLDPDHLVRWKAGDRILTDLARGTSPERARQAEALRGELPPGRLGGRLLDDVCGTALDILQRYAPYAAAEPEPHPVDLELGGTRVTGRGVLRAGAVVALTFSRPRPRRLVEAWLEALALAVSLDRPVDAVVVGNRRKAVLRGPDPGVAARHLTTIVDLAAEGLCEVLPLPPETSWAWAASAVRGHDPLDGDAVTRAWQREEDEVWRRVLPDGRPPWAALVGGEPWAQRGERTRLGSLARLVWWPVVEAER